MHQLRLPYLLFVGEEADPRMAKTATGLAHWRPELCLGALGSGARTCLPQLPNLDLQEAWERGARTLVVGVAPVGGQLPESWLQVLEAALELGFDLANGLHARLRAQPSLLARAEALGRQLIDLREPPAGLPVGDGRPRAGRRILTVGTDCAVGKMFSSLRLVAELEARGQPARFCATGQTGILIAGTGIPLDAVPADFIAGAVEQLAPAREDGLLEVIEGQGSLFHPGYAAVTLGLVHGAQAEALVLCHEWGRQEMVGSAAYPVPGIRACIEAYEREAGLTRPGARVRGLSLNTSSLAAAEARNVCAALANEFQLPCVDPLRDGMAAIVDALG